MVSARDIEPSVLISKVSEDLKSKMEMPEWAKYVKTGVGKDRQPDSSDWWHIRAASILRRVYVDGPVGVARLRTYYSNRHRRGHKPAHSAKGGGKIIRAILQDLENNKMLSKTEKPVKGRKITPEGQKYLDNMAKNLKK